MSEVNNSNNERMVMSNFFLSNTIKEIFSSISGQNLTEEKTDEEYESTYLSYITGIMVIKGTHDDVIIMFTFSKHAAFSFVSRLLKSNEELIPQEVQTDAIMELTNMVAGKIKTKVDSSGFKCVLTAPLALIGQSHIWQVKKNMEVYRMKFVEHDFEMLTKVFFI